MLYPTYSIEESYDSTMDKNTINLIREVNIEFKFPQNELNITQLKVRIEDNHKNYTEAYFCNEYAENLLTNI